MDMPLFKCNRLNATTCQEVADCAEGHAGGYAGGPLLYVEDIYVDECARGLGIGTNLLLKCIENAFDAWALDEHKAIRIELVVLNWNARAIRIYEKLGFKNFTSSDGVQVYAFDIREKQN